MSEGINRKPDWLKVKLPGQGEYADVETILKDLNLHTVCRSAHCPNIADCWGRRTATIMILGDVCTRGCRFCAVTTGNPGGYLDETEPQRVAEAVERMKLRYVVLTSVDRDDLADGGAEHFARTIRKIKEQDANVMVEPLIPDFFGERKNLKKIVDSKPDVIAHNLETVERLTRHVRDHRMSYAGSLDVLRILKELDAPGLTKSGIMVGLGETDDEVYEVMADMRVYAVDILTIGQYLQPTRRHLGVDRFVHPDQFSEYEQKAKDMGFLSASCAPLVRSSYHAADVVNILRRRDK
ncbi:lipoyl synthase [candidate division WOR-3 bacterium]|uniref:Lipoyl synthase n=1 Tax=candidate division WOR-3 bacterium TaxID=2052148 RepID=A0A9D5KCF5_UNCW3|nr:lipoyl synthase [candidate division WOR-3 bacterium]MBD3365091.1 lipoyl synthase [candidate division WOR-3 bacterium]